MRSIRTRKPLELEFRGKAYTVFWVGDLATEVGRSSRTVGCWCRSGVLPESPFRSPRGDRYFTSEMIGVIKAAVAKCGGANLDLQSFTKEVKEGWAKLGY